MARTPTAVGFDTSGPVEAGEVIRPTRVVFRHAESRKQTCRLFPTEARAFDFAAEQADVIVVQDAREAPPAQDASVNRSFVSRSGAAGAERIGFALQRAGADRGDEVPASGVRTKLLTEGAQVRRTRRR